MSEETNVRKSSARRLSASTYQIRLMYESGMTMKEIANSLDCSANAICKRLKQGRIPTRPRGHSNKPLRRPDISTERIVKLYKAGKSINSMCAEFKCGFTTITGRLKRAGILKSLHDSTIRKKK